MKKFEILSFLFLIFFSYSCYSALTDSLVVYYQPYSCTGLNISTSVGKYNATLTSYKSGQYVNGSATLNMASCSIWMNGSNYANTTKLSMNNISGNGSRTVSFWLKTRSLADAIWFGWGSTSPNAGEAFYVGMNAGNKFFVGSYGNDWATGVTVVNNSWTYVTITYNGSHEFLYVNGSLKGSSAVSLNSKGGGIYIGTRVDLATFSNAYLSNLAIWNRSLSAVEINESMITNYSTWIGGSTPSNSCTYSGSGNWVINASDHCNLTVTNLLRNNISITGAISNECCTRGLRNVSNYSFLRVAYAWVFN